MGEAEMDAPLFGHMIIVQIFSLSRKNLSAVGGNNFKIAVRKLTSSTLELILKLNAF